MDLGQHFLKDKIVIRKIVSALSLTSEDVVLEIGAGKGALAEEIVNKVKKLYLVELDKQLCNLLINKLSAYKNVEVVNEDFLKLDLTNFVLLSKQKLKIVGNIPFSITSSILNKIYNTSGWSLCVLMVQKEVAEKLVAKPNTSSFSKLTLITNFYTKVELLFNVSKKSFSPQPMVNSAVVRFFPNNTFANFVNKDKFVKLLDIVFTYKRKTLWNALSSGLKMDKNTIKNIVVNSGINLQKRPHQYSIEDYIKLLEKLSEFVK